MVSLSAFFTSAAALLLDMLQYYSHAWSNVIFFHEVTPLGLLPVLSFWSLITVVNDVVPSGNLPVWVLRDWNRFFSSSLKDPWGALFCSNLTVYLHRFRQVIGWNITPHLSRKNRHPSEEVTSWSNLVPFPPVCIHRCSLTVGWDWGEHLLMP